MKLEQKDSIVYRGILWVLNRGFPLYIKMCNRTVELIDFCGKLIHSFGCHCECTLNSSIIYVCCTEHVQ